MKQLIRRLSRVGDSSQYRPLGKDGRGGAEVAEGHVPVYVGEEMERFEVRAELLGHPAFVEMLRASAREYGYEQRGVLRIPCPVPLFCRVLRALIDPSADPDALDDLARSLSNESLI